MYDILGRPVPFKEWYEVFDKCRKEDGLRTAIAIYWWSTNGSSARIFGYPVYGVKDRGLFYKLVVKPVYQAASKISAAKYWYRYRFVKRHKYNVVYTDLNPGYYDIDTLMLHANFGLLCRYIEDEMGGLERIEAWTAELLDESTHGQQDGYYNPTEAMIGQSARQYESIELYKWWKFEYPADQKKESELLMRVYGGKSFKSKPAENMPEGYREILGLDFSAQEKVLRHEHRALQRKIHSDEDNNLIRLMKIRRSLWS